MEPFVEVYQLMPDNIIRVHIADGGKQMEVLADYKEERHFSVRLTNSEADWLASELKSPNSLKNWIRLENEQVLRVIRNTEFRQLSLLTIRGGQEISAAPIGVILDEVLDKVVDALRRKEKQ
jgi:hypothetical protein